MVDTDGVAFAGAEIDVIKHSKLIIVMINVTIFLRRVGNDVPVSAEAGVMVFGCESIEFLT